MSMSSLHVPKPPRWINTDAGMQAWTIDVEWRRVADRAFSVNERRRLLDQAERARERELAALAAE